MADNAQRSNEFTDQTETDLTSDDPLFELARLMGEPDKHQRDPDPFDAGPATNWLEDEVSSTSGEYVSESVASAQSPAGPMPDPVADSTPQTVAPRSPQTSSSSDELEAQLLAELGGAPVKQADDEPAEELPSFREIDASLRDGATPPAAATSPGSIEDELQALLAGDLEPVSTQTASAPVRETDLPSGDDDFSAPAFSYDRAPEAASAVQADYGIADDSDLSGANEEPEYAEYNEAPEYNVTADSRVDAPLPPPRFVPVDAPIIAETTPDVAMDAGGQQSIQAPSDDGGTGDWQPASADMAEPMGNDEFDAFLSADDRFDAVAPSTPEIHEHGDLEDAMELNVDAQDHSFSEPAEPAPARPAPQYMDPSDQPAQEAALRAAAPSGVVTEAADEYGNADAVFDDFDAALENEFDDLFAEEFAATDVTPSALPQAPLQTEHAEPRSRVTPTMAAGGAALAAGGASTSASDRTSTVEDDVLNHVGISDESSLSPLDELEALMADSDPVRPSSSVSAPPVIETQEVNDDEGLVDFEVPDMPPEQSAHTAPASDDLGFDDFDLELDLDQSPAGESTVTHSEINDFDVALEDAFDDSMFEAELARDMEFADHDRSALAALDDDEIFAEHAGENGADEPLAGRANRKRGFLVAGVVAGVALIATIGVLAMTGGGDGSTAGPVVVEADPDPVKVEPEQPGGSDVPNQDRAVFDSAQGDAAPRQQELVNTAEEPVDIAAGAGAALPSAVEEKSADRLVPGAGDDTAVAGNADAVSVNPRRVRTLIVKPDGTLVEKEPEVATLPEIVAEPQPASEVTADTQDAGAADTGTSEPSFTPPSADTQENTGPVVAEQRPAPSRPQTDRAQDVPVRTVTTRTVAPVAIADRPSDQPVNIVNNTQTGTQVAAAPQSPAPQPPSAPQAATSTPYAVQIASVPSQAGAQDQATSLQRRFANVLGGRGISIQRAEIDGRGTFYRVRVGAQSRADANSLCEQYKRAGGNCFVTR